MTSKSKEPSVALTPYLETAEGFGIKKSEANKFLKPFIQSIEDLATYAELSKSIKVNGEDDKQGMANAKALRLKIAKVRKAMEKIKTEEKADYLAKGNAIQGIYNMGSKACSDIESGLKYLEETAERARQERIDKLNSERLELVMPYSEYITINQNFGEMDESQFNLLLTGAKATKEEQDRIEAENKKIAELRERRREEFAPYRYLLEPDELIPDLGTLTDDYWDAKKKEYKERHERHLEELAAKKVEEEKEKELKKNAMELMTKELPNTKDAKVFGGSISSEMIQSSRPQPRPINDNPKPTKDNFDNWIIIGEVAGKKMVLHPDLYKSLLSGGQHDQIALIDRIYFKHL